MKISITFDFSLFPMIMVLSIPQELLKCKKSNFHIPQPFQRIKDSLADFLFHTASFCFSLRLIFECLEDTFSIQDNIIMSKRYGEEGQGDFTIWDIFPLCALILDTREGNSP